MHQLWGEMDRRLLIKLGTAGLAALALPGAARADDPTINVGDEIDEARWFEVDEFVRDVQSGALGLPPPLSVSWRLIEHWLKQASGLELAELKSALP